MGDHGSSDAAPEEDHPHLGAAAGDLRDGRGGERGGVRGDRQAPGHAHRHQLLPVQSGGQRSVAFTLR